MHTSLIALKFALKRAANPSKIATYKNFHKTSQDDYAAGEEFLGITVPELRNIARIHSDISFNELLQLLGSNIHEEKYVAALILAEKYALTDEKTRQEIFSFYSKNAKLISGWDLVDSTAPSIVGRFIFQEGKRNPALIAILTKFAGSSNLWERRIAIVATYYFIKNNSFEETLHIAELLLRDKHDLIHKAVGWMLREVGKRDLAVLKSFLKKHYQKMPRTMLRYAIERFPEQERKAYLRGDA